MDNTTAAIVSTIMIILGFANGIVVATVYDSFEFAKMNKLLNKAIDQKFESDKMIDNLKAELENERQEKMSLVNHLRDIVRGYTVEAPRGPIERSENACDSDSDCEEDFSSPASPDVQ